MNPSVERKMLNDFYNSVEKLKRQNRCTPDELEDIVFHLSCLLENREITKLTGFCHGIAIIKDYISMWSHIDRYANSISIFNCIVEDIESFKILRNTLGRL